MSSKLVIVADLQHFKLFRVKTDPSGRESLECLLSSDSLDVHQKPSEKLSDRSGHCETAWGVQGGGENHNMAEEEEQRRVHELVGQILQALATHEHEEVYFAAPKHIHKNIIEHLSPALKTHLTCNVALDLTKTPTDEILRHFAS